MAFDNDLSARKQFRVVDPQTTRIKLRMMADYKGKKRHMATLIHRSFCRIIDVVVRCPAAAMASSLLLLQQRK